MFPKLFEIYSFPIHTYGLLLAVALLASIEVMARLAKREGLDRNQVWDLGFIIILAALLGAKLMLVAVDYDYYLSQPSRLVSLEFLQAGGVYYGGLLGAIAGTFLYLWRHPELKFWTVADMAAPCIALGQSIGRLGCLAAGCDYGKPTDLPWAVTFSSEYANRHVGVPLGIPLHPSQAYESLAALAIFLILLRSFKRPHFPGQVFLLYLMLYGAVRFLLEFARGDTVRGLYFDGLISTSQIVSLILLPLALFWWWRRRAVSQS